MVVAVVTVMTGLFLAWLLEHIPQEEALKRIVTRTLMPLLSPLYGDADTSKVVIVTIDDADLAREVFNETWPMTMAFLTNNVDALLAMKPKVLFIDLLLKKKEETDTSVEKLRKIICEAVGTTTVYIAWLGNPADLSDTEKAVLRPRDTGVYDRAMPGCAIAVNAQITSDKMDQLQWEYPVEVDVFPPTRETERSAALEIFCHEKPDQCRAPVQAPFKTSEFPSKPPGIALIWPATSAETNVQTMIRGPDAKGEYRSVCQNGLSPFEAFPGVTLIRELFEHEETGRDSRPCPYHQVIPLRAFKDIGFSEKEIDHALHGKIVIFGADITGTGDKIVSPINGLLPGVHAHAMALDNLLRFQGWYKEAGKFKVFERKDGDLRFAPFWTRGNVFVIFSVVSIVTFLTCWKHYYTEAGRDPVASTPREPGTFARRLGQVAMVLLAVPMLVIGWPRGPVTSASRQRFLEQTCVVFFKLTLMGLIFVVGYASWGFRQGPLQIVEYAAFPFLAHFLQIGESISKHGYAWCAAIRKPNPWEAWEEAFHETDKAEH